MQDQCMDAWVSQQDFGKTARRRVPVEHGVDVSLDLFKRLNHSGHSLKFAKLYTLVNQPRQRAAYQVVFTAVELKALGKPVQAKLGLTRVVWVVKLKLGE